MTSDTSDTSPRSVPRGRGQHRPDVNWARVRAQYEADESVSAIAGEHHVSEGAIRKRARTHHWTRGRLNVEVRALVVRELGDPGPQEQANADVIGAIGRSQVSVVRAHRERAARMLEIVTSLEQQITDAIGARDSLQEAIEEHALAVDPENKQRLRWAAIMKAVSLPVHIQSMKDLALTVGRLVDVERQAYGLAETDDPDKEKPTEDGVTPTAASLGVVKKRLLKLIEKEKKAA